MEVDLNNKLFLEKCDAENRDQFFLAPGGDIQAGDGFELSPADNPDYCLSQDQQPKNNEVIFMIPCDVPRSADTSLWELS